MRKKVDSIKKRTIPVIEINLDQIELMWDYEYQAKHYVLDCSGNTTLNLVLASNSLKKLQKEIKKRKLKIAFISTKKGSLSMGQHVVDEYPYTPRY